MRILNVINTVDPRSGGPAESLRQVGLELESRGHKVEVASADSPSAEFLKDFPFLVHAQGPSSGAFGYAPNLKHWLLDHARDYDALIGRGLWQYHGIALRAAARRAGKPYWVFPHGMLDPWFNRAYPAKALKKRLFWPWQHAVLRDAEAVLFTCEEERLLARQSFRPYKVRERVVSYGTAAPPGDAEGQRTAFAEAFPQTRDRRLLLFLGRIHPKKGCDLLIQAFARAYPEADGPILVMAGPDPDGYGESLKRVAAGLGIEDRVLWTGMLRDDLKWGAFRSAEAFVLPSHQENFGIAVVEALACGTPVLITRPVNIWREVVQDGAGLVDDDTVEGVTGLLRSWEGLSGGKKQEMSLRTVKCFQQRFTIEQAATCLLEGLSG